MAKDNTASNIIMQGKGQYKPLDDSMLQWNAKMQNIRNFEEAKRKNQEQRDLRDKLAEIEALGLPAHLQKKLREDSEEALRQVREEGLDPNSIDFRVKLNRIAGKGKQYEDFVTEGKAAMTQEGMVIEEDEYGTINRRPEYNKKFLSLWDENTEIEDVDALIGEVKEGYSRIAPTLEFTPKEYSELADEFFARNSDAYTTMQELKQQGIEGQNLITETLKVHPDLAEGFNSHMDDATRWVAGQNYARDREIYGVEALGTGADYHKRMSSAYHIRPEQQTKQTTEVDPYKLQAQKDAAAMARKKTTKKEEGYSTTTTPTSADELKEYAAAHGGGEEGTKKAHEFYDMFGEGQVNVVSITKKGSGKELTPIVIGGQNGIIKEVHVRPDGTGIAYVTTKSSVRDKETGETTYPAKTTIVELNEEDRDKLEELYNISLREQENKDPLGLGI